jgi:hypothetical protein
MGAVRADVERASDMTRMGQKISEEAATAQAGGQL